MLPAKGIRAEMPLHVAGFGKSYDELFRQTNVGGYELWLAFSENGCDNPVARKDRNLYERRMELVMRKVHGEPAGNSEIYPDNSFSGAWGEVTRDVVMNGDRGEDDRGRRHIIYISHFETEQEERHELWAPAKLVVMPTDDGIFYPGTLIPFSTVDIPKKAADEYARRGIPHGNIINFEPGMGVMEKPEYVMRGYSLNDRQFNVDTGLASFLGRKYPFMTWVGSRRTV
ncbi:MAG: hypothetical protein HY365_00635 [Candidatus Aenigmarchaeota archaeon]|nr:hypothetical protein [Candidatus Aenigmarchaeota archaeon]